jgi:hypothetical protein
MRPMVVIEYKEDKKQYQVDTGHKMARGWVQGSEWALKVNPNPNDLYIQSEPG